MATEHAGGAGEVRARPGTALYLHLPYCAVKCHYCDFFSVPGEGQDVAAAVGTLLAEAQQRAPRSPRTVYLGGGTPSYLSIPELRELFDGLEQATNFRSSALEVTIECNPESLDRAKAEALLELGATRLSIGLQSLRPEVLELFGRVHSVEQSFAAFAAARAAGVRRLNVDLIYAIPGQTPAEWAADLERVLALAPDHLSAYNLTFEEETPFARWLEDGRLTSASEEVELELFAATRSIAARHGFDAYEISNFARGGEACLHNLNYWRNGEYVGLGPSAASKVGETRSGNLRSIGPWRRAVLRGERALAWSETPSAHVRLAETWWLGLRLAEGVAPDEARRTAGLPIDAVDPCAATATRLADEGFLERRGERFAISARGLPLADALAREFLGPAAAERRSPAPAAAPGG